VIYVGIDDTDTLESRGTNQLARELVERVAARFACVWIVRHQLLFDRRVPYTSKNGSASIVLAPRAPQSDDRQWLTFELEQAMRAAFIVGSDPGLCIASTVPAEVTAFGRRCQREIVAQEDAYDVAARHGITLMGLGGTNGGVIGALAAVGLAAEANDGRVVKVGEYDDDLSGVQTVDTLRSRGVIVRSLDDHRPIATGNVDIGKKLRPNLRDGKFVLFVEQAATASNATWRAVKLV
jgi:tRNA(Ile2) C34 agmatinyltransferase TiaS